jgi:hypothetical protein
MKVSFDEGTGELVIRIPANIKNPGLTGTRKSLAVATTNGFAKSEDVKVNGHPISVSLNVIAPLAARREAVNV